MEFIALIVIIVGIIIFCSIVSSVLEILRVANCCMDTVIAQSMKQKVSIVCPHCAETVQLPRGNAITIMNSGLGFDCPYCDKKVLIKAVH